MNKKFNIIDDDNIRNAFLNFYSNLELNAQQEKYLNTYISNYKNVNSDTLNWTTICDIALSIDSSYLSSYFGILNLNFVLYLIENNLYKDSFIDENSDLILNLFNASKEKRNRLIYFDKNFNIKNLFICEYVSYKKGKGDEKGENKESQLIIDTKLDNPFLVKLLDEFYKSGFISTRSKKSNHDFARNFYKSYDKFSSFKVITDFNFKVFKAQFDFYKENKNQLNDLIKFYIYVHSIYGDIFKPHDPVDIFWITRHANFTNQFNDGFILVDLNPLEPFPTNDRWIIRPNGQEKFTTKLNATNYKTVDFTKIEYTGYRAFLKHYFWNSTLTLPVRLGYFYNIIKFLNFIYEFKTLNIKNNDNYNEITTIEVYSYLSHIRNEDSLKVYNEKVKSIKSFFKNNYFNVELAVFDSLVHAGDNAPPGSQSIPENEVKKLEKHLLTLAYTNDTNYVYYTIFKLALLTNFRISHLLSITTDSIKEAMKEGQYYIEAVTKTSNKEKTREHISKYDYRYLEDTINITAPLRSNAPEEYKNFVFLHDKQSVKIKGVTPITPGAFNSFLKRECKKIKLPEYTAENLRDTSITRAIDYGVENGLSQQEIEMLIRGKSSKKLKHYYDNNESKLFVEATYGVIIGNIDLKGQILETTNSSSFRKDETMDDGCGFCKENECRIHEDIGCPMCKYFIVTLDRIPFYKKKLEQLKVAIENETIEHEKEHLRAIQKLYAAYLTKLLEINQKLERNQK